MEQKQISIVLVNYNGAKFQNDCIKSILKNSYKNINIVIVDNNSSDNSMSLLSEFDDKRITTIMCEENNGVAKGNNIGIQKSIELKSDYTLLLNNDTILKEDLIEKLMEHITDDCVCVPKMYFGDGETIWYGGGEFIMKRGNICHLHYLEKETENTKYKGYCTYSPTTCMLIPNSIFEKIGIIDENYFLYYDDVDFCFRLLKNGFKVRFCEDAVINHLVGQSSGGDESIFSTYYMCRNKLYFVNKYKKDFNFFIRKAVLLDKRMKYVIGKMKKTNARVIKKAIHDYNKKAMGRCDDLPKSF